MQKVSFVSNVFISVFSPLHWEEDDLSAGDSRMSRIVRVRYLIITINTEISCNSNEMLGIPGCQCSGKREEREFLFL